MARKQNISRLKETNFSVYNLRDAFIDEQASYLAALRDEALFSNWGISVLVRIPADKDGNILENNVDEYSNFVDIYWIDTTETVVPKFTEYRQNVSEEGMSADGMDALYPLEVLIPSKLHLPRNSRIIFNEYNSREEKIAREWVVLGTQMKQLSNSKTYTRVANCVPAREETYENSETAQGIIWFDWNTNNLSKTNQTRAQGTIWFIRNAIDNTKVQKIYRDAIWEQIPDFPIFEEEVEVMLYYDDRAQNIIKSGKNFKVNETYPILTEEGYPIEIILNEEGTESIPFELTITKVSESGEILGFKLNTNTGYTDFAGETPLLFHINKGDDEAIISLSTTSWDGDLIQETLEVQEIQGVKYLYPLQNNTVVSVKSLAISVLN